jgi:hypothetical protein
VPIDGYANGWKVAPGCRDVQFVFGPNRLALAGYIASGVGAVLCVLLIIVAVWRRRRARVSGLERRPGAREPAPAPAPAFARSGSQRPREHAGMRPTRALRFAILPALVFGFVFGIIPGIASLPAIAFALWRGVGARTLTLAAAALIGIVVPILYVIHPGSRSGGNHYGYAMAHLAAHYVAVAAFGLLAAALWMSLRELAPGRRQRAVGR